MRKIWLVGLASLFAILSNNNALAAVIVFTGPWQQSAIWHPGSPTFGPDPLKNVGISSEDHRFGAASVASGQITGQNAMPGVFDARAMATERSTFAANPTSQADSWVQFARPFDLTAAANVTVSDLLIGTLDLTEAYGADAASVFWNAGLADPANAILARINPVGPGEVIMKKTVGTVPLSIPGSVTKRLQPGSYQVWGGLRAFARMDAEDAVGGDTANSNFPLYVDLSATAVDEPDSLSLFCAALLLAFWSFRRRQKTV